MTGACGLVESYVLDCHVAVAVDGYVEPEARHVTREAAGHNIVGISVHLELSKALAVIRGGRIREIDTDGALVHVVVKLDIEADGADPRVYVRELELGISHADGYGAVKVAVDKIAALRTGEVELLLLIAADKSVERSKIHHKQADRRHYNKQHSHAYRKLFQKSSVFSVHKHLTKLDFLAV